MNHYVTLTIQLEIRPLFTHSLMSNSCIWAIHRCKSGATTPGHCWPGNHVNERVLHICKVPGLKPLNQMFHCHIQDTWCGVLPLSRYFASVFYNRRLEGCSCIREGKTESLELSKAHHLLKTYLLNPLYHYKVICFIKMLVDWFVSITPGQSLFVFCSAENQFYNYDLQSGRQHNI